MLSPDKAATLGTDLDTANRLVVSKLANVKIASDADLQQAVLDRQDLGDRAKRVSEFFKPFKDMAYKLHKTLCDRENEVLGPILTLDRTLASLMSAYKAAKDRERRAEEQRIAEERHKVEQTRLLEEAAVLEAQGDGGLAAAVVEQAITTPAPVVVLADTTKSVVGLKFRRTWKWRAANNDLGRALQLVPRDYLTLDETKLNGYARSMKETAKIPGIEFYFEDVPVR